MSGGTVAPEGWAPEFDGQRPPFAPGNTLAVKSGAWSERQLTPVADRLLEAVLADETVGYLRAPRYASALQAWATAEARVILLEEWVDGMTLERAAESAQGKTSPLEILRRWEATAATHRDKLGLTPMSAARLGKDVAQGRAADAAAELTRLREQHERATAPPAAPVAGEVVDGDR